MYFVEMLSIEVVDLRTDLYRNICLSFVKITAQNYYSNAPYSRHPDSDRTDRPPSPALPLNLSRTRLRGRAWREPTSPYISHMYVVQTDIDYTHNLHAICLLYPHLTSLRHRHRLYPQLTCHMPSVPSPYIASLHPTCDSMTHLAHSSNSFLLLNYDLRETKNLQKTLANRNVIS